MNQRRPFFSFDLRQLVNGWLCATLIVVMIAWLGLFYYLDKGNALAQKEIASYAKSAAGANASQYR